MADRQPQPEASQKIKLDGEVEEDIVKEEEEDYSALIDLSRLRKKIKPNEFLRF